MASPPSTIPSPLLAGVRPGWLACFRRPVPGGVTLEALAARALAAAGVITPGGDVVKTAAVSPRPHLIFEAFRYFEPGETRVVILGQDPYPDPDDAMGLSFSVPRVGADARLNPSLLNILANLEARKLAAPRGSPRVQSGDLRAWAAQGVLMLNAALTTAAGARGAHRELWREFTAAFVGAFALAVAEAGGPYRSRAIIVGKPPPPSAPWRAPWLLWGSDAGAHAPAVEAAGHPAHRWSHPSPLADNRLPPASRFVEAPHFADVNAALAGAALRPIEWDPLAPTYVFADGSCLRNGQADAVAGFGVYAASGPLRRLIFAGGVAPMAYRLADPLRPIAGFAPAAGKAVAPTNNRAEYLGACWALLMALRAGVRGRVVLVSDSQLVIRTLEEWLPARRRKGKAEALENFDLVVIAEALLAALRTTALAVELRHVRGHQKKPPPSASAEERLYWHGNDQVDALAGEASKLIGAPKIPTMALADEVSLTYTRPWAAGVVCSAYVLTPPSD